MVTFIEPTPLIHSPTPNITITAPPGWSHGAIIPSPDLSTILVCQTRGAHQPVVSKPRIHFLRRRQEAEEARSSRRDRFSSTRRQYDCLPVRRRLLEGPRVRRRRPRPLPAAGRGAVPRRRPAQLAADRPNGRLLLSPCMPRLPRSANGLPQFASAAALGPVD